MATNKDQKPKTATETDAKSRGADWWARSFALIGIIVSLATLLYNIHKDHIALRENIEPELECHVSPMHGPPYDNLTFALRNVSPIPIASVTVEYHSFMLAATSLHLIGLGIVEFPVLFGSWLLLAYSPGPRPRRLA